MKLIAHKLESRGIDFCMFFEPDNGMGFSAICTEPLEDGQHRSFFRKWNLYKHTA